MNTLARILFRSALPLLTAAGLTCVTTASAATESVVLTDVVKSTGIGNINLFKNITAAQLEAFRLDNNGELAFAVDVNEAADGTEKADSQGVALQSVALTVTIGSVVHTYTQYTTATKAMLASGTSTTRSERYTLIGDTGSSRITNGGTVIERFDSTIHVVVPDALAGATAARLDVIFLTTNVSLGDPERFYDFTNGFEDMAIISSADSSFLDTLAPGRTDAPAVVLTNPPPPDPLQVASWTYFPSATGFYLVAYEDQYPNRGDYDFNDLTVAYRVNVGLNADGNVVKLDGIAILVTRGADYNNDWHLRFMLPASASGNVSTTLRRSSTDSTITKPVAAFTGALDLTLFENTRYNFVDQNYDFVNTLLAQAIKQGPKATFSATLAAPMSLAQLGSLPFDPYLYVYQTGYEIHLPGNPATAGSANLRDGYTSFKDSSGLPFAMTLPDTWQPPLEHVDMGVAYPDVITYVTSSGKQKTTWYTNPAPGKVKTVTSSDWLW